MNIQEIKIYFNGRKVAGDKLEYSLATNKITLINKKLLVEFVELDAEKKAVAVKNNYGKILFAGYYEDDLIISSISICIPSKRFRFKGCQLTDTIGREYNIRPFGYIMDKIEEIY